VRKNRALREPGFMFLVYRIVPGDVACSVSTEPQGRADQSPPRQPFPDPSAQWGRGQGAAVLPINWMLSLLRGCRDERRASGFGYRASAFPGGRFLHDFEFSGDGRHYGEETNRLGTEEI
jgi:hypothetical protein